ncbi:hypothetical protein [Endozoicomonas sp. YOMI1]|uniref:hypothetical protein n=1 Tax=Endozoicomonas sp. YOMI1 TaxID=2828739 RepID=UPI0021472CB6|nr:hypothetical protein [Endozoicomonas sp. YOMI1]
MTAGSKVLFIGDPAQLPPVGESLSPALSEQWLREHYHLHCASFELTEIQRQVRGSAILEQATAIRNAIAEQKFNAISDQSPGVIGVTAAEGIRQVLSSYQRRGQGSSVMVTYSNARALDHNRAGREQLWGNDQLPVQQGEQLLVNKNAPLHGLSNGDLVKVNRVLGAGESRRIIMRGVSEPVWLSFSSYSRLDWGRSPEPAYVSAEPGQKASGSENDDTDWQRFAFNPGQEPLYELHLRLRDTWRQQGIEIISIEHLSYCQRYTLCRGDYTAVVQQRGCDAGCGI